MWHNKTMLCIVFTGFWCLNCRSNSTDVTFWCHVTVCSMDKGCKWWFCSLHLHECLKENGKKFVIGLYHKRHHYLLNTLLKEFHSQLSMRRLQREERQRAVGMLENGAKQRVVAQRFNVSQSVISRLWAPYRQTQNVDDRPRSGRPRATTQAQDRLIRTFTLRNRQIASHLQDTAGVRVTGQTIRNRLHARGLKAYLKAQSHCTCARITHELRINFSLCVIHQWCA